MGKVLVVPNADFSNVKSRKLLTQPVEIETIYENSYFTINGNISTNVPGTTPEDYPEINIGSGTIDIAAYACDLCLSQVEIPEGAIAVGGVANTLTYTASNNTGFQAIPVSQRKSDGTKIATELGISWYIKSQINTVPYDDDDTFVSLNTASDAVCNSIRVLARVDNISQVKRSSSRLLDFVAKIHPDAKYLDISWVLPRSVTATYHTTPGDSTLGVGLVKPDLYWIFE